VLVVANDPAVVQARLMLADPRLGLLHFGDRLDLEGEVMQPGTRSVKPLVGLLPKRYEEVIRLPKEREALSPFPPSSRIFQPNTSQ